MKTVFNNGTNIELPPASIAVEKLANCMYGTATVVRPAEHDVDYISTLQVAPCGSLAVMAEDAAEASGIIHIFVSDRLYGLGEEAVRRYARENTQNFLQNFSADKRFITVPFGGVDFAEGLPTPPTPQEIAQAGLLTASEDQRNAIRIAHTVLASYWVNDEILRTVADAENMDITAVYQGAGPYDGFIDLRTRQIVISHGKYHENVLENADLGVQRFFADAAYNSYMSLHPATVTPLRSANEFVMA
ncbi:MAG: hypothetical protein GC136_02810 [Alphaproteobacteria bacterium]|nr:hypothetical protein [Alphaproteobacteria bacterium]